MFSSHYSPKKAFYFMLTLAGFFLFTGCGVLNQTPLAPPAPAKPQAGVKFDSNPGLFAITFSPKREFNPATRATKPSGRRYTKTASGWFSPESSGELKVNFEDVYNGVRGKNGVRVKQATFKVEKGSIDHDVQISMTVVSGSTVEDVWVQFSPWGQEFHPSATLTLVLVGKLNKEDLNYLEAFHIEGNLATEMSVQIVQGVDGEWIIIVKVPGFSRYSLGGNDVIPGTDAWKSEEYAETYSYRYR